MPTAFYYDSRYPPDALLAVARQKGVDLVDTATCTKAQRDSFYYDTLMRISILRHKQLRGRLRSHKAGIVSFSQGVLVTGGSDFFIGDEALAFLNGVPMPPGFEMDASLLRYFPKAAPPSNKTNST